MDHKIRLCTQCPYGNDVDAVFALVGEIAHSYQNRQKFRGFGSSLRIFQQFVFQPIEIRRGLVHLVPFRPRFTMLRENPNFMERIIRILHKENPNLRRGKSEFVRRENPNRRCRWKMWRWNMR